MRGKRIVPVSDIMVWGRFFESDKRIIASTWLAGRVHVSTVFLGLDHNYTPNAGPVLFETMIFGNVKKQKWFDGKRDFIYRIDLYQRRYRTRAMAIEGHKEVIRLAISEQLPRFMKTTTRKDRHKNRLYNRYKKSLYFKRKPI